MSASIGRHTLFPGKSSPSRAVIILFVSCFLLLLAACTASDLGTESEILSQATDEPAGIQSPTPTATDGVPAAETPAVEARPVRAELPDLGAAPELSNEIWLNTDQTLRLEDLGGKVILLDMWTFG